MAVLVWIIYRSRLPGRGAIEYLVMFPQAVPRLVFGLALLRAWLIIPIPIYGTLWLMALAYFTVLMPLGVRTLAGVVLQIDKSLEECARVCGASLVLPDAHRDPAAAAPGILAAWLLMFIASVRELGVSIFLVGSNAKVIAPSIIDALPARHRADGGDGADPVRRRVRRAGHPVPRDARHDQGAAVSATRIEVDGSGRALRRCAGRQRRQLHGRAAST